MKQKQSSRNYSNGFTLIELMVTTLIGMTVVAITLDFTQNANKTLNRDMARTRLTQNLRGSLDIINTQIRITGENLSSSFPAILLENNSEDQTLILRRALLAEALPICTDITAGAVVDNYVEIANDSLVAGCDYTSQQYAYSQWSEYRQNNGNSVRAYLYNIGTETGEYFTYNNEEDTGTDLRIKHTQSSWINSYPVGSSVMYLIEEKKYQKNGDILELIEDGDTANPLKISFGITDFNIEIALQDNTTLTTFTTANNWNDIKYIQVSIAGQENTAHELLNSELTGKFFPRNILSS
jgi:type II secretory pathway pseudopilin PulG